MPSKTEEYLALAQRTANGLTRYWESWTDYLTTASRLYKYPFADQLMIYAQRPDATACASFDIWNNRMNRYVRRGSKGIALLDQSSSVPRLHYVFDVSDTGVRRNSRDPEVWQHGPDLMQPVSEMIAREYGVYHERLSQQISDLTGKLVDSYWDNNSGDILDIVDGSFLIDYDEAGQEFQFKSAAAISILYTVLERCGLEPDGHFDRDDFQAIFSFSTPAAVYALGTAVSECSRDVLRNIERTVKTTIRRRNVERSQYEYEQQERDLLDRRGLPAPEPDPAPAGESTGQIRQIAPDLSDGASPGAVQFDAPVGDSASAPVGSGTDRREPDAADHTQPTHCLLVNDFLSVPSIVQAEQIFTIDKSRVLKFLGHLTPEEMNRVDDAVRASLALNPMGSIQRLPPIIRSTAAYAPPEVVDGKPPLYPYTPIKSSFEDAGSVEDMMLYTELEAAVHAMIQRLEYSFTFNPSLLTIPKRKQQVAEILKEAETYIWRIKEEMRCA